MSPSRLAAATLAALVFFSAAPAFAQATRTWISGVGDDVNPCSRTAPCKTFPGAISKTAAGGEIDVLNSGGFGGVTVVKSMTLDGSGVLAGILVPGTNGVTINAGVNDVVIIRGLSIVGGGTGVSGIRVVKAGAVFVEKCIITGFKKGIEFAPSSNAALYVKDSIIRNNGDSSDVTNANIYISTPTAGVALSATIDGTTVTGGSNGIDVSAGLGTGAKVTIHNSVISGSAGIGVHAEALTEVNLERGVVGYHLVGLQADATGLIRTSNVMIPHNGTGVSGSVTSFGDNALNAGNAADGSFTSTLVRQ
jgi:hypothetical protein